MAYKDPEINRAKCRVYRQAHLEELRAHDRERWKTDERKAYAAGFRAKYREKAAALSAVWRQANPEKVVTNNRTAKSHARRELEVLAGRPRPQLCDICARSNRTIHFDHDHQRGHFRGWICGPCNMALGLVKDDAGILRKMIAYLERHRVNHSPQLTLSGI